MLSKDDEQDILEQEYNLEAYEVTKQLKPEQRYIPQNLECPLPCFSLNFHPNLDYIAAGFVDGTIEIYNYEKMDMNLVMAYQRHSQAVQDVFFIESGRELISCGSDGMLLSVDMERGKKKWAIKQAHNCKVTRFFELDGKGIYASGDDKGVVKLWDMRKPGEFGKIEEHGDTISALDYNEDVKYLYASSLDGSMSVMELAKDFSEASCYSITEVSKSGKEYTGVAELHSGGHTICSTNQGKLECYTHNRWHGKPTVFQTKMQTGIEDMIYMTEEQVACVSQTGYIDVFSLGKDYEKMQFKHMAHIGVHEGGASKLALSNDGRYLASCGLEDDCVKFWNVSDLFKVDLAKVVEEKNPLPEKPAEEPEENPKKRKAFIQPQKKKKKRRKFNSTHRDFFADL